ncbi:MAG: ABC transporter ATP-binding protein [Clostridia bacterium]|nr:ABC transporter ATP-binding protein [Clostridia bacterium]
MRVLLQFAKKYRKAILFAVLFMILDVFCEILQPILMANIIGKGIESGDKVYIIKTGLLMIFVAAVAIFAGCNNSKNSATAGVGFAAELRRGLFTKVQQFSFKNIDKFSTASLATRLTNDVTLLQNTAIMAMRIMVRAPLMFIFALIMTIRLNAKLSIIIAIAIPLLILSVGSILIFAFSRFTKMQTAIDNLNSNVQENLTNVRVVKSFVREDFEKEKFKKTNDDLTNASLNAMNLVIFNMPILMLIMNLSIVAVVYFGGKQILNDTLDVATMSAFLTYITHILMSLMIFSMLFVMLSRATASYKRIVEVLKTDIDLKDNKSALKEHKFKGDVAFKNVYFKYDNNSNEYILQDINFEVKKGTVVAIIGGTGSGKSSLVQLLPRLYDTSRGTVLVDGKDVKKYSLNLLRDNIAMVLQKNTLFSGTIAENLRWGNQNATDEEVINAAKAAQAHDFIMNFPDGYNTWIEQGGVNVSGGQKQRLCIARAILKKPAILILDDSTSAVDTKTERKIRESFNTILKDTTTFIIAQRISSVKDADLIIVLDDGKIVAQGTHDELLKNSPEYQEIYYSQQDKDEGSEKVNG